MGLKASATECDVRLSIAGFRSLTFGYNCSHFVYYSMFNFFLVRNASETSYNRYFIERQKVKWLLPNKNIYYFIFVLCVWEFVSSESIQSYFRSVFQQTNQHYLIDFYLHFNEIKLRQIENRWRRIYKFRDRNYQRYFFLI